MNLKVNDRRAREIAERVPPERCGQCGQHFDARACGPTHAAVSARAIEAARADIPDLLADRAALLDAEAAARATIERMLIAARTAAGSVCSGMRHNASDYVLRAVERAAKGEP